MAAKGLLLVMEEGSGRILAARIVPAHRLPYEYEQLVDHFEFGATDWGALSAISQTFAIQLKRMVPKPTIQTDQQVTVPVSSSPRPLP